MIKTQKKSTTVQYGGQAARFYFPERSDDKKKQGVLCEADGRSYRWVVTKVR